MEERWSYKPCQRGFDSYRAEFFLNEGEATGRGSWSDKPGRQVRLLLLVWTGAAKNFCGGRIGIRVGFISPHQRVRFPLPLLVGCSSVEERRSYKPRRARVQLPPPQFAVRCCLSGSSSVRLERSFWKREVVGSNPASQNFFADVVQRRECQATDQVIEVQILASAFPDVQEKCCPRRSAKL